MEIFVHARTKLSIKREFDVALKDIQSRIKVEQSRVWQTGVTSPIIIEVTLKVTAHII